MYGLLFTYICFILMINVGRYTSPVDPRGIIRTSHVVIHGFWTPQHPKGPWFLNDMGGSVSLSNQTIFTNNNI